MSIRIILSWLLVILTLGYMTIATAASGDLPPDIGDDFKVHNAGKNKQLYGRIAFTATIGKYERIFVADLNSGSVYPILSGRFNNSYPTWSLDGKRLVFSSDRGGKESIFIARWDGTGVIPKKLSGGANGHPSWSLSKGGPQLFYYKDSEGSSNIYAISPWGKKESAVTNFSGRNITPRLAPDRQNLAYTTDRFWPGWDVCIFNLKTNVEKCPLKGNNSFCRPAWHKNSNKILYSFGAGNQIDIGLYDLELKSSRTLTSLPNREYDPTWSPDYKSFAFVAEPEKLNRFQIYVLHDGDKKPELLVSSPYSMRYLTWDGIPTLKLEAERIRELDKKSGKTAAKPSKKNVSE